MYPLQVFFLISILAIFPLAWFGGGHTERSGVALFLCLYIVGYLVQHLLIGNLMWGEVLVDVVGLAGVVWLALKRERWWPLAAAAIQIMILLVYAGTVLIPGFSLRSGVVANMVLGALNLYCLLGGVLERILAGETPASAGAIWTRVRRPTTAPKV
jgi:hypothetical protein